MRNEIMYEEIEVRCDKQYLSLQIIARQITNWENPRTQADYENSYTFKMFLFQFINYYSSLMYTAFFKVRITVYIQNKCTLTDPFYLRGFVLFTLEF